MPANSPHHRSTPPATRDVRSTPGSADAPSPIEENRPVPSPGHAPARPFLTNMAWNWLGVVVEAGVGLLMVRLLIHELGKEMYGVWIAIGSLVTYLGMLDFGMRAAVGRYIGLRIAKDDREGVQEVLATAATALLPISLLSTAFLLCLSPFAGKMFGLEGDHATAATRTMQIVALQLGIFFFTRIFDAALWAMQRFDLINMVDISSAILRCIATWVLVKEGYGIVALAMVVITGTIASAMAKLCAVSFLLPGLKIRLSLASSLLFREMVGYGLWNFLMSIAVIARTQLLPVGMGAVLGVAAVGPFSIVMRLCALATVMTTSFTGVFAPMAVRLYARGDEEGSRRLVNRGAQLGLCLGIYFASLFYCLGGDLFEIWIGADWRKYGVLLSILGLGEIFPLAMAAPQGAIQAIGRHRPLAVFSIFEALFTIGGGGALCYWQGLPAAAAFVALSASIFRGLCVYLTYCSVTNRSPVRGLGEVFVRPFLAAVVPVILLERAVTFAPPTNWGGLFTFGIGFSLIFGLFALFLVWGWRDAQKALALSRGKEDAPPRGAT